MAAELDEYREYTVKVKDRQQNITHTLHRWALSQQEANQGTLEYLREVLGHDELEIV